MERVPIDVPSDHLLRVMAAVPVQSRVLDLGCGEGVHADPLVRLGFEVWACDPSAAHVAATRERLAESLGSAEAERRVTTARLEALGYPDDHFDWVVSYGAFDQAADAGALFEMLAECRRVMKPGAWVVAAMHPANVYDDLDPTALAKLFAEASFAVAEMPDWEGEMVRGIFRKVPA